MHGNFEFSGLLLVDKPAGMTSHDVIAIIRKKFVIKKVGHCGTLDPAATGLLGVLIGHATKLSEKLTSSKKRYDAILKLGIETDTQDIEGKIIAEKDINLVSEPLIRKVFSEFIGEIEQLPPMYSASKVSGKKLYEYARKGIEIERQKKKIQIYKLDIKKISLPFVEFDVECSKGTYIRTLCADIGKNLSCGGTLFSLRRTASGNFSIEQAHKLEDILKWNQKDLLNNLIDPLNSF